MSRRYGTAVAYAYTGMAMTCQPDRDENRRTYSNQSFLCQPNLHDGEWFIAQGRKYAEEANAVVAKWAKWTLVAIAGGWLFSLVKPWIERVLS